MTFEQALKNEVAHIRDQLSETNATEMTFSIDINGRINDGDLEIKFSLGTSYGKGGCVTGGILENVVREYKRRFNWAEINQPLCLPHVIVETTDEEIPF